jgi:hypothetical protein
MKKPPLLLIVFISLFFSCTKDKIEIDPNNPLIGIWNYSDYNNNVQVYARSREFSDNQGFKFNTDGTLLERKNSGWCGTPPITYSDYPGKWAIINDTLIRLEVGYWGGSMTYNLDIESVNSDSLKVITVSVNE